MQLVAWLILLSSYIANAKTMILRKLSEWFLIVGNELNPDIKSDDYAIDENDNKLDSDVSDFFKNLRLKRIEASVLKGIQILYPYLMSLEDFYQWVDQCADGKITIKDFGVAIREITKNVEDV